MNKELVKQVIEADPDRAVRLLSAQDPKTAYELIFEHPDPPAVARALPFEDAYLLVKAIGETDALALLEMLDAEQIQGFFDLDCWSKDRLSTDRLVEWTTILLEFDDDRFMLQMKKMDEYLQVAIIKSFVEVIKIEEPDENPFLEVQNVFVTPDNRYALRFSGGDEQIRLFYELMMRIYRLDLALFYWLLESVYWEQMSLLEESAYQEKVGRLEARGFPEYYSAIEVLAVVDPDRFVPRQKILPAKPPGTDVPSSMFLAKYDYADSLLRRALAAMPQGLETVQVELMVLINTVIIAQRLSFDDFVRIGRQAQRVDGFLSLALERQSAGDVTIAAKVLAENRVLDLYKIGRSLVIRPGRKLKILLPKICADAKSLDRLLFEGYLANFIEGMLQRDPVLAQGQGIETFFSTLAHVDTATARVEALYQITRILHDHLGFAPAGLADLNLLGTNQVGMASIFYTQLFGTAFSNDLLGREFRPVPLDSSDCHALAKMIEPAGEGPTIAQVHRDRFYAWFRGNEGEPAQDARAYFENLFGKMASQLTVFAGSGSDDVRYLTSLIVKIPY